MSAPMRPLKMLRSTSGAGATEFAVALPMLLLLLFPAIDYALAFSGRLQLGAAATQVAERITARGQVLPNYSAYEAEARTAGTGATGQPTTARVTNWLECNGNLAPASNNIATCSSGQTYARYVRVEVSSTYSPLFAYGPLADGVPITGSATVRVQ